MKGNFENRRPSQPRKAHLAAAVTRGLARVGWWWEALDDKVRQGGGCAFVFSAFQDTGSSRVTETLWSIKNLDSFQSSWLVASWDSGLERMRRGFAGGGGGVGGTTTGSPGLVQPGRKSFPCRAALQDRAVKIQDKVLSITTETKWQEWMIKHKIILFGLFYKPT